jgi:hypothetical protein
MELHLSASLRSMLHESQREVREDMRGYLRQLVLASDLSGEALGAVSLNSRSPQRRGGTGTARGGTRGGEERDNDLDGRDETVVTLGKYHAARREKEREIQHILDKSVLPLPSLSPLLSLFPPLLFSDHAPHLSCALLPSLVSLRMDDISSVIVSLQESSESHEKSMAIDYRALERRLEECVTLSSASVSSFQSRYSDLEKSFQEREERMRSKTRELEEELLRGLRESNEVSAVERQELSQRMVLVEKMVETVMERVDMSKTVFEGLFSSSTEVKRFQNAAVKLEGLLVEFTSVRYSALSLSLSLSLYLPLLC